MTTLRPRDKGTVALHEGLALSVIGSAGSAGQVRRVDPVLGGLNYLESWTVADGALPQIGPYIGKQQFFITCTAGSIDATVGDAVLGAAQFVSSSDGGQTLSVGGVTVVNLRPPIATLRAANVGDSISEHWVQYNGNGTSVVSPGIVRMTFASAYSTGTFWVGDKVKTSLCSVRAANQMDATITATDPSRLWVEYTSSADQEHAATGGGYLIFTKCALWGSGYMANAAAQAGIPFSIAFDASISGGDSGQINEVLVRNITDCDLANYAPGMNDIYLRGFTFAQIKANDLANLAILKPRARVLAVHSIPARNSTSAQWSSAKFAIWRQVNEFRRQWCVANGAIFVDVSAAELGGKTYCDPLNVNNDNYITGTNQVSADSIHPRGLGGVVYGAIVAARALAGVMKSEFLPASASIAAAEGYLVLNAMMKRTTGASVTGSATFQNLAGAASPEVADGFTVSADQVSGSAVIVKCGVIPRTKSIHGDSIGNAQRIIIDNTAGGITAIITLMTPSFAGSLVDGDTLEFGGSMLYSAMATPGSGDPAGLLCGGQRVQELHTSGAPSRYLDALSLDPSTGLLPGHPVAFYKADRLRRVADAGAFNTVRGFATVQVAAGQSACVDIGRQLYRRALSL